MPNPMHPTVGPEDYISPYNDISYSKGPKIIYGDVDVFTVILNDAQTDDDDEWGRTEQIALRMVIDEAVVVHKELFGWSSILGLKDKFRALSDRFVGFGPNYTEFSAKTSVLTLGESGETMLQDGLLTVGSGAFLSSDNVGLSLSNGSFTVETNPLTLATTIKSANIGDTASIVLGPSNIGNTIILDVNGAAYRFTETTLTLPGSLSAIDFEVTSITANVASINSLISPSISIQILTGDPAVPMGVNLAAGSVAIDSYVSRYGLVLTKIGGAEGLILSNAGLYITADDITLSRIDITYEGINIFGNESSGEPLLMISYSGINLKYLVETELFTVSESGLRWCNRDEIAILEVDDNEVKMRIGASISNTIEGSPNPVLVNFNLVADRAEYKSDSFYYGLVLTSSEGAKNLILKEVDLILLGDNLSAPQLSITTSGINFYGEDNETTPLLALGPLGIRIHYEGTLEMFTVDQYSLSYFDRESTEIFKTDSEKGLTLRLTGNANEFIASPLGIKIRKIDDDDVIFFQTTTAQIQLYGHDGILSIFSASAGLLEVSQDVESAPPVLRADTHGISSGQTPLKWKTVTIPSVTWPANTEVFPYSISGSYDLYDDGDGPILTNIRNVVIDVFNSDGSALYSCVAFGVISQPSNTVINLGAYRAITDSTIDVKVYVTIFYTE